MAISTKTSIQNTKMSSSSCFACSNKAAARGRHAAASVAAAVAALLAVLLLPTSQASFLTGTDFPFENCVQKNQFSRYSAELVSYTESPSKQTSQFCIKLKVSDTCTPGPYRCCNTHINKIKFYPSAECRGSMGSATVYGKTVTSVYWEEHGDNEWIAKVTPLKDWLADADSIRDQVVCFNLRKPCWSLQMFSNDHEVLEYALYDKKVDDYECCPVGELTVPVAGQPMIPAAPMSPRTPPPPSPSPKPTPSPDNTAVTSLPVETLGRKAGGKKAKAAAKPVAASSTSPAPIAAASVTAPVAAATVAAPVAAATTATAPVAAATTATAPVAAASTPKPATVTTSSTPAPAGKKAKAPKAAKKAAPVASASTPKPAATVATASAPSPTPAVTTASNATPTPATATTAAAQKAAAKAAKAVAKAAKAAAKASKASKKSPQ